ncbi:nucleoredoxin-like protein 2 isoform X2 [Dinothrombium tinctorium]|uniref:Nucleoredoxin-like protein 2 isoform X2 n=1 Tax=Dinothrombium tinctorium TaxID=1965070 RepID=A0A3S3PAZ3_9ACAR|nr:nucleoredoxin-like protein 2 isoform X2 [Dinothrombium tinctorium]
MDLIENIQLVRKDGTQVSSSEVFSKQLIGFYFGAGWCAPCRIFTTLLADAYNQIKRDGHEFEIIYVSSDQNVQKFQSYFSELHGDWLAIPFRHEAIKALRQRFRIKGVPVLVIIRTDGTVITDEGRADIQAKGVHAFEHWISQAK